MKQPNEALTDYGRYLQAERDALVDRRSGLRASLAAVELDITLCDGYLLRLAAANAALVAANIITPPAPEPEPEPEPEAPPEEPTV